LTERILVTGATGFIGSGLCRALLQAGQRVVALHRASSSLDALQGLAVERVVGDILLPETLPPAMQGIDIVFHAAAQPAYWRFPGQVLRVAIEGTRNVVVAARSAGVRRLVLTSSLAAMGVPSPGALLTEEDTYDLSPRYFPYGYAKRQAELEALQQAGKALQVVIVNPSIVLGPGDRNQISGSMITDVARIGAPFYPVGGTNVVHVQDVVDGHLAAARLGRPGQRYILGGENLSYKHIFTTVAQIVGKPAPRIALPAALAAPAAFLLETVGRWMRLPFDAGQLRMSRYDLFCDISKAKRELGLPEARPFRQAIEEAYQWYREQDML
jgi:dihydroflavonol-4-reductase